MQNVDSEKKVIVDGEELGKGKEKKLGVGMKIKFGDDSEWQVRCCAFTFYAGQVLCRWLTQICCLLAMLKALASANNVHHPLVLQVLRNVRTHA